MLAAGDGGPRQTLDPISDAFEVVINAGQDASSATENYWLELIITQHPRGLVCGTSDSPEGKAIEFCARRAAAAVGLPIAAIEDFAGNYRDLPGTTTRLLLLESPTVVARTRDRLGAKCPPAYALSPARYDPLRRQSPMYRAKIRRLWSPGTRGSVLWAGQPETADCLMTLETLLPQFADLQLQLLFKAHPQDVGYRRGAYRNILGLSTLSPIDLTTAPIEDALMRAPRLVVTQFSSFAIEAGFYGIPSLNVLLPGAGGDRLMEKKDWLAPPHCIEGAAFFTHDARSLPEILEAALNDDTARGRIMRCFDSYFSVATPTLPTLAASLGTLFENGEFSP